VIPHFEALASFREYFFFGRTPNSWKRLIEWSRLRVSFKRRKSCTCKSNCGDCQGRVDDVLPAILEQTGHIRTPDWFR
jgi:hypothetical protein